MILPEIKATSYNQTHFLIYPFGNDILSKTTTQATDQIEANVTRGTTTLSCDFKFVYKLGNNVREALVRFPNQTREASPRYYLGIERDFFYRRIAIYKA